MTQTSVSTDCPGEETLWSSRAQLTGLSPPSTVILFVLVHQCLLQRMADSCRWNPSLTRAGHPGNVSPMALHSKGSGHIVVVDEFDINDHHIVFFDPSGRMVRSWFVPSNLMPPGVVVNSTDLFFVVSPCCQHVPVSHSDAKKSPPSMSERPLPARLRLT